MLFRNTVQNGSLGPKWEALSYVTPIRASEILVFIAGHGLLCETESSNRGSKEFERKKDERHAQIQQSHDVLHSIPTTHC